MGPFPREWKAKKVTRDRKLLHVLGEETGNL